MVAHFRKHFAECPINLSTAKSAGSYYNTASKICTNQAHLYSLMPRSRSILLEILNNSFHLARLRKPKLMAARWTDAALRFSIFGFDGRIGLCAANVTRQCCTLLVWSTRVSFRWCLLAGLPLHIARFTVVVIGLAPLIRSPSSSIALNVHKYVQYGGTCGNGLINVRHSVVVRCLPTAMYWSNLAVHKLTRNLAEGFHARSVVVEL